MGELKKIIYNCKKATYLMDKKLISRISFREWIELRIHLYGCSVCRLYGQQSQKINIMLRQLMQATVRSPKKLDERFKESLQKQIEDELS